MLAAPLVVAAIGFVLERLVIRRLGPPIKYDSAEANVYGRLNARPFTLRTLARFHFFLLISFSFLPATPGELVAG